jgi:CubicO group peptidase (beta-lactamase class C family)
MKKRFLLSILGFVYFPSFAQDSKPFNSIQQLADSINAIVKKENIAGLMVGITAKDSVIFSGGFGYADIKTKRVVDSNTLFRMGSVTKMFVSLGILQLIKDGKFGLDDELKKIAPEVPFSNNWESTEPVKLVHLLEHTSGFDDMKLNKMYTLGGDEYKGLQRVLAQKNSLVCRWRPGERFAYSNPNYAILGYIIEKYSGMPFQEYLGQLILKPLDMTSSNFNTGSKLPERDTKEYVIKERKLIEVPSVTILNASTGALWSSSADMLKFIRLFLRNGSPLFSDTLLNEMEKPHSSLGARSGLQTCYALANRTAFIDRKFPYRGHDGLVGTCFSTCNYNRELGIGFVIASNSNHDNASVKKLVLSFIESNWPPAQNAAPIATRPTDIKSIGPYVGLYQLESPRNQIAGFKDKLQDAPKFFIENGNLFYKSLLGAKKELVQTAPLTFAFKDDNSPLITFTTNKAGKQVMLFAGTYYEKVSGFWGIFNRIAVVLAVLIAVLSSVMATVSVIGLFAKKVNKRDLLIRLLPVTGVALLIWSVMKLLEVEQYTYMLSELATVNVRTLSIFTGTLAFGIIALLTLFLSIKNFRKTKQKWFAVYFLLTGISLFIICAVLWQAGWIGMRTWAM